MSVRTGQVASAPPPTKRTNGVAWLALLVALYAAVAATLGMSRGGGGGGGAARPADLDAALAAHASRLRTEIQDDFKKAVADAKESLGRVEKRFEEKTTTLKAIADDGARRAEDQARAGAVRADVLEAKVDDSHRSATSLRGTIDALALAVRDLESRPVAAPSRPGPAPAPAKPDKPPEPVAPAPGPTAEQKAALEAKVRAAIADLSSPDIGKVFPACDVLGKAGDLAAVEPLLKVLRENKDPYGRTAAASALGALHACDAVPTLLAALLDKDDGVVLQAGVALRKVTGQDSGLNANPTIKEKRDAKDRLTRWWRDHEAETREKWKQPAKSAAAEPTAPGSDAPGSPPAGDPK